MRHSKLLLSLRMRARAARAVTAARASPASLCRFASFSPLPSSPTPSASKVICIAVTGGPCGGKTSALNQLADILPTLGVRVLTCPEFSTLFFAGGAAFPAADGSRAQQLEWDFQKLKAQLAFEDAFRAIAESSGQPTVLLCDRGALDTKVFVDGPGEWEALLKKGAAEESAGAAGDTGDAARWDELAFLRRYDAVLHLVTTAIGAEAQYNLDNEARRESLAEARAQDLLVRDAWLAHPNFVLISNKNLEDNFDGKIRQVTSAVCGIAGIPVDPLELKRQWVVELDPTHWRRWLQSGHGETQMTRFLVETDFVACSDSDGEDVCVRRRLPIPDDQDSGECFIDKDIRDAFGTPVVWDARATYSVHERRDKSSGSLRSSGGGDVLVREKTVSIASRTLTKRAYQELRKASGDSGGAGTIRMRRTCFVHEEQLWKLDECVGAQGPVHVLTLEGRQAGGSSTDVKYPSFVREVGGELVDGMRGLRNLLQRQQHQ